jgi:hypothetical protein
LPFRAYILSAHPQRKADRMNIRQLLLDVDKAVARPSLLEIAEAVDG